MNLLIVDDEQLTRDGLIHSIDWSALGIHNIYQADDGIHGLALSRKYHPEIILSDVRMPRMDGIEMANQLKSFLPDCSIIFMSGYSDKEYLKAAIKLKAISYVEKPIDLEEIRSAVSEAAHNHTLLRQEQHSKNLRQQNEQEKLAIKLSYLIPQDTITSYLQDFAELGFQIKTATYFTTLILKLYTPISTLKEAVLSSFIYSFRSLLTDEHLELIYANKQDEYYIFHLFGTEKTDRSVLVRLSASLKPLITTFSRYNLVYGKTVCGLSRINLSYNSAVILLQSTFFAGPDQDFYWDESAEAPKPVQIPEWAPLFSEHLKDHDREKAFALSKTVYLFFMENSFLLPGQAKDIYYKMLNRLHEAAHTEHMTLTETPDMEITNIWDYIETCSHLYEMHSFFQKLLKNFFEKLQQEKVDNSVVYLIKEFINQQYHRDSLSVKDISEHVFRSSSYVCTIFKSETGQTLNQYLTEFRLERAKRLLEDSRYKITDISIRVGYHDGNYFGKIFKKNIGLSPSEYREKNVK